LCVAENARGQRNFQIGDDGSYGSSVVAGQRCAARKSASP